MISSHYQQARQTLLFCLLFVLSATAPAPPPTMASTGDPSSPEAAVSLQHGPVSSAPAGKSVPVSVTIADAEEIFEVRLYFKTMAAASYFFLPMTGSRKGIFTVSLPPARNDTKGIDYLLLFKNSHGETRKTKPFRLLVLNDYHAPPPAVGEFEVLTEQDTFEEENREFAVPLKVVTTPEPLLVYAVEDPYPPQVTPGQEGRKKVFGGLSGLGGVSFSIKIGGVGFSYRGFSSH
jgi:hypothetical protein